MDESQTMAQIQRRRFEDLLFILLSGLILGCLILASEALPSDSIWIVSIILQALQVIFGLAFVLYIPGYLLQALFFAREDELTTVERVGLSLGLSVALVTLLSLLLNVLPWGLHPMPIIIGQTGMIMILMIGTAVTRSLVPTEQAYQPSIQPHFGRWWSDLAISEKRMMMFTGGTLVFTLLVAAWIFLSPTKADKMTEFYMLGKEGQAEDYPREITAGETMTMTTGIVNREGIKSTYNIVVKVGDQVIGQTDPIVLENGATWQQPIEFTVPKAGKDQQINIILDRNGQPSPYRTLRLWTNVKEAETP